MQNKLLHAVIKVGAILTCDEQGGEAGRDVVVAQHLQGIGVEGAVGLLRLQPQHLGPQREQVERVHLRQLVALADARPERQQEGPHAG
jgi:hypothetical protein